MAEQRTPSKENRVLFDDTNSPANKRPAVQTPSGTRPQADTVPKPSSDRTSKRKLDLGSEKTEPCPVCDKPISKSQLQRHKKSHEGQKPFSCSQCPKTFTRAEYARRHEATHKKQQTTTAAPRRRHRELFDCPYCSYQSCQDIEYLATHIKKFHSAHLKDRCSKCGTCGEKEFLQETHLAACCRCSDAATVLPPLGEQTPPLFDTDPSDAPDDPDALFWQDPMLEGFFDDADAYHLINWYWKDYRQRIDRPTDISRSFHFRLAGKDVEFSFKKALQLIYSNIGRSFNFSVAPTVLLRREREGQKPEYQIFFGQDRRGALLQENLVICDLPSLNIAIQRLENLGPLEDKIERPGTDWKLVAILSMGFFSHIRPAYLAGGRGTGVLPTFLSHDNDNFVALERDRNGNLYTDCLCAFRCIVYHFGGDPYDRQVVEQCYLRYKARVGGPESTEFKGVAERDLSILEHIYGIKIQIFRKSQDSIECLRKVVDAEGKTVLNLHSQPAGDGYVHFSVIKTVANFVGRHTCPNCFRMFQRKFDMVRHQRTACHSGKTQFSYPGGNYSVRSNIFDLLLELGILVPMEKRRCRSLAVLDCEAALQSLQLKYEREAGQVNQEAIEQRLLSHNVEVAYHDTVKKRLQFPDLHVPITCAIASTLEPTTRFLHNADPEALVQHIYDTLLELSKKNYEEKLHLYSPEFQQLADLCEKAKSVLASTGDDRKAFREVAALRKIENLQRRLDIYCKQFTVITFNGSRYDLNLIKPWLFKSIVKDVRTNKTQKGETESSELFDVEADAQCDEVGEKSALSWPRAIVRGSAILCLSTPETRWLDMINYLGPGVSLAKFLKAYNPKGQQKGAFPYELIKDYSDLEAITQFPQRSAFFSKLRKDTITEKEYEEAKSIWDSLETKNMLSYIEYYNKTDVEPFLQAALNFADVFWQDFGVCVFREAQSIPGVCLVYLFRQMQQRQPLVRFGLFSEETSELCDQLYSSITGGLSIINQRIAEKDITPIRGDPTKLVSKIIGYDANALYLWSLMQPAAVGLVTHWRLDEHRKLFIRKTPLPGSDFKKRRIYSEVEFLRYCSFRDNVYINTAADGAQLTLGLHQYRVDGWAPNANPKPRVYLFNG